jgi:hypothetical protein
MKNQGMACIAGIHEHPLRRADGISTAQLHADVALGACRWPTSTAISAAPTPPGWAD